jgi:hypothetical protein
VELVGKQADLYETIRLGMEKTVREALSQTRGLAKSQITILDALAQTAPGLLRPAVCSSCRRPAKGQGLGKTGAADGNAARDAERKGDASCCFRSSPACSALIEAELKQRDIRWVKLTGQSQNREAAD